MFNRSLRIGTRTSPLALRQAEEAISSLRLMEPRPSAALPDVSFEIVGIDTYGDKDKTTPISEVEGTDFFTREIEDALLKGGIDFAVHSAKDLPDKIPDGLAIAAITKSIDPYDALVSKGGLKIGELKKCARVGTSSNRRKAQLKKYRSDFQIIDIRGNIQERLEKLDTGALDAVIVAACALVRMGLEDRIAERVRFEILAPHPLQGALAIEAREGDKELMNFLKVLNGR